MRVLVTGATGFVGGHLVPTLLARGHIVTAVAREVGKARAFPWFDRVRFVACDLHVASERVLTDAGVHDALVHLAWPGLPRYRERFHFEENLPRDYRFVHAAVRAGIRQVLIAGTCFEYGLREGPIAEDAPTEPVTAYGLAKDTLHRFLRALQRDEPFVLQWARLFYMHGPGQSAGSLLSQLDRALSASATSFDMSGGEQLRDYQPVEQAVAQLCSLLEHQQVDGTFNLCSGVPTSVRSLVERHLAARGRELTLNLGVYPYPTYEPMAFWGVPDKLRALQASLRDA